VPTTLWKDDERAAVARVGGGQATTPFRGAKIINVLALALRTSEASVTIFGSFTAGSVFAYVGRAVSAALR